jgi:hypothetical protein
MQPSLQIPVAVRDAFLIALSLNGTQTIHHPQHHRIMQRLDVLVSPSDGFGLSPSLSPA